MLKPGNRIVLAGVLMMLALGGLAVGAFHSRFADQVNIAGCELRGNQANVAKTAPCAPILTEARGEQGATESGSRVTRLRFIDSDTHEGVGNLAVEISLGGGSAGEVVQLESDADGWVGLKSAGTKGATVTLTGGGHRFVAGHKVQTSIWWGEEANKSITLQVERYVTFSLQIMYADRLTYAGEVEVQFGYERSQKYTADARGMITFDCKPAGVATAIIESRRPGFNGRHVRVTLDSSAATPVEIVLPEGDAQTGTLEIDLSLFPTDSEYEIYVAPAKPPEYPLQNRPGYSARGAKGGEIHVSKPLPAGEYVARVTSAQSRTDSAGVPFCVATSSGPVLLEAGQSKRIRPIPRTSYAARVRVIDEMGNVVSPAVLGIKTDAYHHWPIEDYKPGRISARPPLGYADADGVAIAAGLCVEVRMLTVEAPGCELCDIEVNPIEGAVIDVGTVVLKQARGVIEIKLEGEGTGDQAEYEVQILQPLGQVVFGPAKFTGASFKIERLPLRAYTISIRDISGRTAAFSQNVRLDAAAPAQVATFVMRRWPFEEDEK